MAAKPKGWLQKKADKKKSKIKLLIKAHMKRRARRIVIGVALFLLATLFTVIMLSTMMANMAAILGFTALPQAAEEYQEALEDPCGCVLLSEVEVQTSGSNAGNYGFTTGSLATGNVLNDEILGLLRKIQQTTGTQYTPLLSFGSLHLEGCPISDGDLGKLYDHANPDIWADVMRMLPIGRPSEAADRMENAYGSRDSQAPKTCTLITSRGGHLNVSRSLGAKANVRRNPAIGPFQIEPAYGRSWAAYIPDEYAIEAGHPPAAWADRNANGNKTGSPFYLPDILYNHAGGTYGKRIGEARGYLEKLLDVGIKSQLGENGMRLTAMVLAWTSYNVGNMKAYSVDPRAKENSTLAANWVITFMEDADTMLAMYNQGKFDSMSGVKSYLRSKGRDVSNTSATKTYGYRAMIAGMKDYEKCIGVTKYGSSLGAWPSEVDNPAVGPGTSTAQVNGAVQSQTPEVSQGTGEVDWSTTVLIGDSLTVGMSNKHPDLASSESASTASSTAGWVADKGIGIHINAATSRGIMNTTDKGQEGKTQVADIRGMSTVIINLGTNSAGYPAATFRSKYESLLDSILENNQGAKVYIGTMLPVNDAGTSALTNQNVVDNNEVIKAIAVERGYTLIDGYTYFKEEKGYSPTDRMGVHYSSSSGEEYKAWWEFIKATVVANQTGAGIVQGTGETTAVTDTVIERTWSCTCLHPCPYCSCHDDEGANSGKDGATVVVTGADRVFPESVQGQTSGLFGTAEQMRDWILNGQTSSSITDSDALEVLKYVGMAPKSYRTTKDGAARYMDKPTGTVDRYMGLDGFGTINYCQNSGPTEEWIRVFYARNKAPGANKNSGTFMYSGCGSFATACVLSTLEKKWVNPPEVILAIDTYGARTGKGQLKLSEYTMVGTDCIRALLKEIGYKYESGASKGRFKDNKATIDECLKAGGMVILVSQYMPVNSDTSTSGHYIVLRDIVQGGEYDGCYLMANSLYDNEAATGERTYRNSAGVWVAGYYSHSSVLRANASGTNWVAVWPKDEQYPINGIGGENQGFAPSPSRPSSTEKEIYSPFGSNAKVQAGVSLFNSNGFHGGLDCWPDNSGAGNREGQPVYAIADGVVKEVRSTLSGANTERGYYVVIEHESFGKKWCSMYQHLKSAPSVSVGTEIKASNGVKIGEIGSTGTAVGGPHLHLEIWPHEYTAMGSNTQYVDPSQVVGAVYTDKDGTTQTIKGGYRPPSLTVLQKTSNKCKVVTWGSDKTSFMSRYGDYANSGYLEM